MARRVTAFLAGEIRDGGERRWRRSAAAIFLALAGCLPTAGAIRAETSHAWATGALLQSRLRAPTDVFWSTAPLRQELYRLAEETKVAMLLDRRVDPGQQVTLTIRDQSLEEALRRIAGKLGIGKTMLGPVVYFGPLSAASRLRTLAELCRQQARSLGPSAEARLSRPVTLRWDDLATPRTILSRLAESNGWKLADLEQVPHDLWAAADLPPLPLGDALCLILVQFDLTYTIESQGNSIRLLPISGKVAIERRYPGGRHPQQTARYLRTLIPDAEVQVTGGWLLVRGLVEDHERIAAGGSALRQPKTAPPASEKHYTLRQAKGQLGDLIVKLAAMLEMDLKMDREALKQAGVPLDQPVSLSVTDATIDELFERLLQSAGCTFRRTGRTIEILPAKRSASKD